MAFRASLFLGAVSGLLLVPACTIMQGDDGPGADQNAEVNFDNKQCQPKPNEVCVSAQQANVTQLSAPQQSVTTAVTGENCVCNDKVSFQKELVRLVTTKDNDNPITSYESGFLLIDLNGKKPPAMQGENAFKVEKGQPLVPCLSFTPSAQLKLSGTQFVPGWEGNAAASLVRGDYQLATGSGRKNAQKEKRCAPLTIQTQKADEYFRSLVREPASSAPPLWTTYTGTSPWVASLYDNKTERQLMVTQDTVNASGQAILTSDSVNAAAASTVEHKKIVATAAWAILETSFASGYSTWSLPSNDNPYYEYKISDSDLVSLQPNPQEKDPTSVSARVYCDDCPEGTGACAAGVKLGEACYRIEPYRSTFAYRVRSRLLERLVPIGRTLPPSR